MNKKIGVIGDIHGNDVALKIVLDDLKDCDEIISLGDLIGIGPNNNEVLDIVRPLKNFRTVLGNHERYCLYGFDNPLSCIDNNIQKWVDSGISKENMEYLKKIPLEIHMEWNNKTICFLHYARPRVDSMMFTIIKRNPSYEDLLALFKDNKEDILIYGHEHLHSMMKREKWFINLGSTGCPHPIKDTLRYGILHLDQDITFEYIEKKYDSSNVIKSMVEKDMPNKEFVSKNFYKVNLDDFKI